MPIFNVKIEHLFEIVVIYEEKYRKLKKPAGKTVIKIPQMVKVVC